MKWRYKNQVCPCEQISISTLVSVYLKFRLYLQELKKKTTKALETYNDLLKKSSQIKGFFRNREFLINLLELN